MANEFRKVIDTNNLVHPVCDDNRVDWESYAKTGVHQMLPLTVDYIKALNSSRTWNGNSCTHNGVTFTINTDSKGRVISITRSNTATGFAFLRISGLSSFSGDFILNGGKDAGNMVYIQNETTSTQLAASTGNDTPITLSPTADIINCIIGVNQGTSDEQIFYPMLRLASDTDSTYAPYAMTNGELTQQVTPVSVAIATNDSTNIELANNHSFKCGKIITVRTQVHIINAISSDVYVVYSKDLAGTHGHYGGAVLVDSGTGDNYGLFVAPATVDSVAYTVVFASKGAIPAGWYTLTYTYIAD